MKHIISSLAIALAFLFTSCGKKTEQPPKPNVIFIFADDQCFSTINALGNREIKTPTLDHLATNGVTFTHAYNMGAWNGAVCAASRAMLNVGRSVWRTYALEKQQHQLADSSLMWPQLMESAGYNTFMTGKWHVRTSPTKLFNHTKDIRGGMPKDTWEHGSMMKTFAEYKKAGKTDFSDIMPFGYNRPTSPADTAWQPWDKSNGGFWEGGTHWSEVLADNAIEFIDSAVISDKPYFMYLAFNASHDPRQSPKEYIDMYPLENISVPENYQALYPHRNGIGNSPSLRDEALAPFPRTEYAVKKHRQEYYAIISHMDAQIGRIIKHLEANNQLDNTYIIYTADHGLAVGQHGFIGKQNMYDHSIRVPLFVMGPKVPKNEKIDVDIYLQDVMATALDIADAEIPEFIEFNSLLPFINGEKKESNYPAIYGCYKPDLQRMIRKDGFKLIVYPQIKTMRLYHVANDHMEMNDLAGDKKYDGKKKELFKALLQLQKEMDDPLDLSQFFPAL